MSRFSNPGQVAFDLIGRYDPTAAQHLEAALQLLQQKMDALAASMLAQGRSAEATAQALAPLVQRYNQLNGMLDSTRGGMGLTAAQAQGAASAVQGLARGFEDVILSGGRFSSAINNVPQLVEGIARAARMAGPQVAALSAASTLLGSALFLAIDSRSLLMRAMGAGKLRTEAEEMEELGKKTEKTAAETEKLLRYKEREAEIRAQDTAKTDVEKAQQKAVRDAIAEADKGQVDAGLVGTGAAGLIETDAVARAATEALNAARKCLKDRGITDAAIEAAKQFKDLKAAQQSALDKAAANLRADAATDPTRLDQLIKAIESAPASFPEGFLDKLKAATPEGRADEKALEEEMKATEKVVLRRLHDLIRGAHDALKDESLTPGEKAERIGVALADVDRGGMVGHDVRRAREQIGDMLSGARKAHESSVDASVKEAEAGAEKFARDLSNAVALDLTRELHNITTGEHDPAKRFAAIQAFGRKVGQAALDPSDRARVGQAALDALRATQKAQDHADHKTDADAEAAAKKFAPDIAQRIQAEALRNQLNVAEARRTGAPVSATEAEFQSNAMSGNIAVTLELLRAMHTRDVGIDLARAGGTPRSRGTSSISPGPRSPR